MASRSGYFVKKIRFFHRENSGGNELTISNTDRLDLVISKLSCFHKEGSEFTKYGILLMGPSDRLLDFIIMDNGVPNKNIDVGMKSIINHVLPDGSNKKCIQDMTYFNMTSIYIITNNHDIITCSKVIRYHIESLIARRSRSMSSQRAEKEYRVSKIKCIEMLKDIISFNISVDPEKNPKSDDIPITKSETINIPICLPEKTSTDLLICSEERYPLLNKLIDKRYCICPVYIHIVSD